MNELAVIEEATTLIAAITPAALPDSDLIDTLTAMQAHAQRSAALVLALLQEANVRNLPSASGSAHPIPWTAGTLKISRASAARLHRLGRALADAPSVAEAYTAGRITDEQARLMADALAVLPAGSDEAVLDRGADLGPDELRVELRELQEELDPEGTQQRDEDAAARAEERTQERRRIVFSRLDGSNLVQIQGYLDAVAAASFLTAVDALCAPRNRSALGVGFTDGEADLRTAGQRRHDAVCEIGNRVQATATLPDHGGDRPQAVVTVALQTLIDGLGGAGFLDDGTVLTPAACRLLACDARILPVVMDGESLPIDMGRQRRLFTGAVRRALNLRDRGCAFPGCDRGLPWTEAHHCVPWHKGGPSDLTNGVLACGYHHRLLHHSGWRVQINPTDGLPEFFAPGDSRARRNRYHRRP